MIGATEHGSDFGARCEERASAVSVHVTDEPALHRQNTRVQERDEQSPLCEKLLEVGHARKADPARDVLGGIGYAVRRELGGLRVGERAMLRMDALKQRVQVTGR